MQTSRLDQWQHSHHFSSINQQGEARTYWVLGLTLVTMVAEIISGTVFGSMALLADGWHMGTHAAAFLITIFAYRYARKHLNSQTYTFGPSKVSVLAGFTSAIALALVALLMLIESVVRLFSPEQIHFNEAILVAIIGLIVNIVSAILLHGHDHSHHSHSDKQAHQHDSHEHEHEHEHEHHDHNLKAAYLHVLADALTSLLAIIALIIGKYMGLFWLDAVMGIVGGIIITRWAYGLLKQTAPILLDASISPDYITKLTCALENQGDCLVADIHIWKISADHHAASIVLIADSPKPTSYYKQLLAPFDKLHHLTIEVNQASIS